MPNKDKIHTLDSLVDVVANFKEQGRKVVMCHGVFDLLHVGHIRHFEEARSLGDVLIVTITPDEYVNKGPGRPAFTGSLRLETLASLDVIDGVAINKWATAEKTLEMLNPDIYCKGGEYKTDQVDAETNMQPEIEKARDLGIEVGFTDGITFSSSQLLNRHFSPFSTETDTWLSEFRKKYSAEDVIVHLERASSLKVLVVGEAIIDEYVYCGAFGKATKDPVLACKYNSIEACAGGSLAVANHLASFCREVGLVTYLGDHDRREDFIRSSLQDNVQPFFVEKSRAPTIHKRRFVDEYSQTKLFELYVMDDSLMEGDNERQLLELLEGIITDYDLVISVDYGHGMITPDTISLLCEKSRFLAVNAQSNAGNRGFNTISKYHSADYICLADHEIAVETRLREGDPQELLLEVAKRVACERFTVTKGKWGSLHYECGMGFMTVPALATHVTDRVGAGDAVLALTSMMLSQGAPWDIVGFVGNVAGAEIVAELGNRTPVGKIALCKHIVSLLK
jgi:rfaE bifunctional protein kinase chain/domain/rfaE bifunctional protein nucleotidyltransferase chain/domain